MATVISSGPAPCSMSGSGEYIEEQDHHNKRNQNFTIPEAKESLKEDVHDNQGHSEDHSHQESHQQMYS